MKNTEIRIGNLVKRNGLIVTVDEQTFWDMKRYPEQYEPVTLTEERLIQFGFEVHKFDNGKQNQYRFNDRLIVIRNGFFVDYGSSVCLQHIHQLQNLYFALNNEELTIKN